MVALPISWDPEYEVGEEDLVPLNIAEKDLDRIRNFLTRTPPPYDES